MKKADENSQKRHKNETREIKENDIIMASHKLQRNYFKNLKLFKRIRFILWLTAYRVYTFPGNVVYYLYVITVLRYLWGGDLCWLLRRMRQEQKVKEKKKEYLSARCCRFPIRGARLFSRIRIKGAVSGE